MATTTKPSLSLRRRALLGAAIAALGLCGAAPALAAPDLVDFKVVDRETGQPLRVWRRHGRLFVAGEPGSRYALRVTNNTNGRVMVVMSVDGVNVYTGETASYDQAGYVFEPHQSWDLTGWRKSQNEVAAFVFAPLPKSYAARTGRPAEVGVIGIATFKEKPAPIEAVAAETRRRERAYQPPTYHADDGPVPPPPPPSPPPPPEPADTAYAAKAAPPSPVQSRADVVSGKGIQDRRAEVRGGSVQSPPDEKLGTGHGERETSVIHFVQFERATSYPQTIQQIEYDTRDNLIARGVIREVDPERHPRPFPVQPQDQGFVPDPPPQD